MAVDFTPTEKSGKKKAKVKSSDSAISRFRQWLIDSYNGLFKIVIQPQLPSLRTLGLLVVAFVIGLIWAYVISPTSFYNASPNQLSAGQRDQYIILLAGAKQGQLYDDGTIVQLLARVERPADAIQRLASSQSGQVQFALQELLPLAQQAGNGTAAPGEGSLIGSLIGFIFAIIVFFLLANIFSLLWGLIIGGYVERFLARFKEETDDDRRAKVAIAEIQRRKKLEVEMKAESAASGVSSPLGEPLLQRISTYTKGRIFDDSFAIEDANDMFLGETGATIAKAIGESQEPTAIEIWLFDKEDFVRTLTKLVVSEHAYNDPVIRSELEPKVENPATDIILAQPGAVIALETNQILVQAKIADMSYGTGPLPPNSYFESLTIQMQAWEQVGSPVGVPKPAAPPMPAAPGLKPLDAYEIGPPPQMPSPQIAPPPPSAGGLPSLDSYEIGQPPQMPSGTSGGFPPAPPARPTSPTPFPPRRPFEDEEDDDPFGGTGDFTPLGN